MNDVLCLDLRGIDTPELGVIYNGTEPGSTEALLEVLEVVLVVVCVVVVVVVVVVLGVVVSLCVVW